MAQTITTRDNRPARNCVTVTVDPATPAERDAIGRALLANGHHHTSCRPGSAAHFDITPTETASVLAVIGRVLR